jgi:hypothetical protein
MAKRAARAEPERGRGEAERQPLKQVQMRGATERTRSAAVGRVQLNYAASSIEDRQVSEEATKQMGLFQRLARYAMKRPPFTSNDTPLM